MSSKSYSMQRQWSRSPQCSMRTGVAVKELFVRLGQQTVFCSARVCFLVEIYDEQAVQGETASAELCSVTFMNRACALDVAKSGRSDLASNRFWHTR
jgi:hypothetical protein